MTDLIEKLQGLSVPSREVDALIALHVGLPPRTKEALDGTE